MSGYRRLGRRSDQRKAMLRAMVTYLLENGQIKTTLPRAKEVAPLAEKMITLAKKNDLASYRQALSFITKEDVAKKLFSELNLKYQGREGGYTRVVKIGPSRRRRRDGHCPARLSIKESIPPAAPQGAAGGSFCSLKAHGYAGEPIAVPVFVVRS